MDSVIYFEREYELHGPDGTQTTVRLQIGKPYLKDDTERGWRCDWQLVGISSKPITVGGRDSLEALLTALYLADFRLRHYRTGYTVYWLGGEDTALPTLPTSPALDEATAEGLGPYQAIMDEYFQGLQQRRSNSSQTD
jgi:hypothetical protein